MYDVRGMKWWWCESPSQSIPNNRKLSQFWKCSISSFPSRPIISFFDVRRVFFGRGRTEREAGRCRACPSRRRSLARMIDPSVEWGIALGRSQKIWEPKSIGNRVFIAKNLFFFTILRPKWQKKILDSQASEST